MFGAAISGGDVECYPQTTDPGRDVSFALGVQGGIVVLGPGRLFSGDLVGWPALRWRPRSYS